MLKKNYNQFWACLKTLGYNEDERKELVLEFSNQRTSSSRECSEAELIACIEALQAEIKQRLRSQNSSFKPLISKILAFAHELKLYQFDDKKQIVVNSEGKPKLCYNAIDAICIKRTRSKKPLFLQNKPELCSTVVSFEKILTAKRLKKQQ
jgi:hypothetical protein